MNISGTAVSPPELPQPEEKNLGQNVRPLTKLPDERPEPVRPPSLERNRPKITQLHTKSEVIRQRTGSTGLPPSESAFSRVPIR